MGLPDEVLKIKEAILEAVPAEQIYLFGSYAYGEPERNSDFDFYIVLPEGGMRPLDAMNKIGMAIFPFQTKPVDLLAGTKATFERRKQQPGLERTIAAKGVKLYERSGQRL